jgi:hypothetical protein
MAHVALLGCRPLHGRAASTPVRLRTAPTPATPLASTSLLLKGPAAPNARIMPRSGRAGGRALPRLLGWPRRSRRRLRRRWRAVLVAAKRLSLRRPLPLDPWNVPGSRFRRTRDRPRRVLRCGRGLRARGLRRRGCLRSLTCVNRLDSGWISDVPESRVGRRRAADHGRRHRSRMTVQESRPGVRRYWTWCRSGT